MAPNRIFQITLIISFAAHGALLFFNPNINPNIAQKKEEKLEISYVKAEKAPIQETRAVAVKKELPADLSAKVTAQKIPPPPFVDKENFFKKSKEPISQRHTFIKPALIKPDIIAVKKKITLPALDLDKIDNPGYISYYQIVREKIRRSAYGNYTGTEAGEIYISFVIAQDGSLKEARLIEEKSSASAYLGDIALRSVKDASPFPKFPETLASYPQLSFKVIISFGTE